MPPVSEATCRERVKTMRRLLSATLSICSLMAIVVGWSMYIGYCAHLQAESARQTIAVYSAKGDAEQKAIHESLDTIQINQRRLRELLDQLLQSQGHGE